MTSNRKPYPKGQRREITAKWLADVRAAMTSKGITGTDLANELAVHKTLVSKILAGKQQVSALVNQITDFLGIDQPLVAVDETDRRIMELVAKLSPSRKAKALRILAELED